VKRPLARLFLAIPLTGMLLAGSLAAAWLALGSPQPASGATWMTVHRIGTEAHLTDGPGQPFFLLALGNDARTDADPGLGDAIHVIGVNPATGDASILDVPRDTEAPGGGKINAFHASGGLPSIANQLNRMMGITISYAVTTNFPGFISMVDEIGGVEIDVTEPMVDHDSGTDFPPGHYRMTGDSLLAYTRDRKSYPQEGDRQRTLNQGKAIIAALATLRAQNPGAAGTAKLTVTLARHVRTDNLDLAQMYELGRLALSIDPARIKNVVIPTGAGAGTNLSVPPAAQDLFADFRDDAILQNH
jgi:polyisoprenyl-teichoic acid--peptidoglycan teichoic acid transferase